MRAGNATARQVNLLFRVGLHRPKRMLASGLWSEEFPE